MLGASASGLLNMQDQVAWIILHRFEGGLPHEFLEVRRQGHLIWFSRGRTGTLGHEDTEVHGSERCACARYHALVQDRQTEGFVVSAEGLYPHGSFDIDAFKTTLKASTLKCFANIIAKHAGETLCGFAYLTEDDVMTISCAANTQEAIARETDPDLQDEARFNVSAWPHDDGNAWLDAAYRMLVWQSRLRMQAATSPKPLSANTSRRALFEEPQPIGPFRRTVFETLVATLSELRQEGVFDDFGQDFGLLVQVSDGEQIPDMVSRLNSDEKFLDGYRAFAGLV